MTIPLALYVHVPWCLSKCPYCDFHSYRCNPASIPEAIYVDKLIIDLASDAARVSQRELCSIFIGGGTPSLLSAAAIGQVINAAGKCFSLQPGCEITIEVNPGTIDTAKCAGLYAAGVSRVSIGAQSFQAEKLADIGRVHSVDDVYNAVAAVKAAGFTNFNLDLMYGLPNQSIADALFDLKAAICLEPTHISWYQLTLEPGTKFFQQQPKLPDHDYLWEMQQAGQELLAKHGFIQYEISAYSRAGYRCKHNLNYWEFGDYLGIGARAHGKITIQNQHSLSANLNNSGIPKQDASRQGGKERLTGMYSSILEDYERRGQHSINASCKGYIWRYQKIAQPQDYISAVDVIAEQHIVNANDLIFEFALNAFRLYQPIPVQLFIERTGLCVEVIAEKLSKAQAAGLIKFDGANILTTDLGRNFLNNLLELFG